MVKASYYSGIFLISAATLLLEISLTRVFSVLFFHHFAFLMISTALFGFGLSGIFLFFRPDQQGNLANRLSVASLLFSLSVLLSYKLILLLPYGFQDVLRVPTNIARLVITYAILAVPFFFSGYVISLLLTTFPEAAGKYYAFDLAGAAVGCLSVLWLVPHLGASGAVALSAACGALAALFFRPPSKQALAAGSILLIGCVAVVWNAETLYRLPLSKIFEEKHGQFYGAPNREIEYSAWSPVSRIDVLVIPPNRLIHLDGGSNISFMLRFSGNFKRLRPRVNWRSIPYLVFPLKRVCIIGPGGGEDVLNALSFKSDSVTAVELDPLIVDIVQGKYSEFLGGIFHHPSVHLLNDEGRSFLRRSKEQFDLIQTVHNCSPMAIASGALNLSESYLFTVEAFREYWNHLTPGGLLAINRGALVRAASIASIALQQEGINDPQNYVFVTALPDGRDPGFYLKKGKLSAEDIQAIQTAAQQAKVQLQYVPLPDFQKADNVYYQLLNPSFREKFIGQADVNLEPSTDNWPFFDHYQPFGQFRTTTSILPGDLNGELRFYNMGDLALITLLIEAILLSSLFILMPLLKLRRMNVSIPRWPILVYFSALGIGFILIEISLIQKHILFMGQPVYSIATVLFSLLLSAGAGSFLFQSRFKEGSERSVLLSLSFLAPLVIIFEGFCVPFLFHYFLGFSKLWRFSISSLFILPLGLVLGIPFPLGVRILARIAPQSIAWGWGLNAYSTVVGSVLAVIFAVTMGFRANFVIALLVYLAGFASFLSALRYNYLR